MLQPGRIRAITFSCLLALLITALPYSTAVQAQTEPPYVTLEGRAVLPADTFAAGPPSGFAVTGATNNRTVPFASQPVQGISAILPNNNGNYLVMEDNGYGAKANSGDFRLRWYNMHPDFSTGKVEVLGYTEISDPKRLLPFPIVNENTDRVLTGADFDPESFRMAPDGTLWYGEELGPFLFHTDVTGRLLEPPIPTPYPAVLAPFAKGRPYIQSPDNPDFVALANQDARIAAANLPSSKGFEGMALNGSGTKLYPLLEGPLISDTVRTRLLIQEFDLASKSYSGNYWFYPLSDPANAIGEMTAINDNEFMVIERDNNQGAAARFKRIYKVDLRRTDATGVLQKELLVDLMAITDNRAITSAETGAIGLGPVFQFPFTTIESVFPIDSRTLIVVDDNNYPFSSGRRPGLAPDDNEFILVRLPGSLNLTSNSVAMGTRTSGNRIESISTLPQVSLGAAQNGAMPGTLANDRGFLLGGIGSDLWHSPGAASNEFWMVTDRGPNGQIAVNGANRRTFPVPDFTPLIMRVGTGGGAINIGQVLPIVGQSGKPVTGLSNIQGYDETPYDYSAQTTLPFNPNGLDTEGLVRTSGGPFWLADEYSPSVLNVDSTGKVIRRYIPSGVALSGTDYPVSATLPAIFGKRKINRGFEALALSPDERTLFVALQSPLSNPDAATGDASRQTRILALNPATGQVSAEYVYRFDPATDYGAKNAASEMKVSGLVALNDHTLLVLERTDAIAKLYTVDLNGATNILGSAWDNVATAPSLESLANPAGSGISVLPKRLVIDLTQFREMPQKIEGVTVLSKGLIAVANDNDFDIGDVSNGTNVGKNARSRLITIRLAQPLP